MRQVFVTGMGVVSSLGIGVEENLKGLAAGRNTFAPARLLQTTLQNPVAEIGLTNKELTQLAGINNSKPYGRTSLLGLIAAKEALAMAGLTGSTDLLLLSSSTTAGVETNENIYLKLEENTEELPYFHCNYIPLEISRELGLTSRQFSISTACSSSANGIMLAARLIRSGKADRILVGGNDALSRFTLNGFNALEIASPTGSRPFDKDRNGVTLGEAAGYLVLESEEAAKGKTIYGEVKGYANVNEAYHATATSPDGAGAKQAIADALKVAHLEAADISYINAHGTGTMVNDLSESVALASVFGDNTPVSSTKGNTGHTLAACGALEAVFSLLALREQKVWGNSRLLNPLDEVQLDLTKETRPAIVKHVLSNSFGFGGNDTSLIFSQP